MEFFFEFVVKSVDLVVERIIWAYKELASYYGTPFKSIKRGTIFHPNNPWHFFNDGCHEGICGCGITFNLSY